MNISIEIFNWQDELYFVVKLLMALIMGAAIGWEREKAGKEAGIRTFGLISMGACAFALVSMSLMSGDPSRIASNVVVGIGFMGGGVIFHQNSRSHGLTTAASLWVSASVGLSTAFGLHVMALALCVITLIFLHLPSSKLWSNISHKRFDD